MAIKAMLLFFFCLGSASANQAVTDTGQCKDGQCSSDDMGLLQNNINTVTASKGKEVDVVAHSTKVKVKEKEDHNKVDKVESSTKEAGKGQKGQEDIDDLLVSMGEAVKEQEGPQSIDDDIVKKLLEGAEARDIDEEAEGVEKNHDVALMQADDAQNRSLLSARIGSGTGGYYGPYTFNFPSAGQSTSAYCALGKDRTRMTFKGSNGITYNTFTFDSCHMIACTFSQCPNGFWYTSATPSNGQVSLCTCCGTGSSAGGNSASPIYPSKSGNKIYKCTPGSGIR